MTIAEKLTTIAQNEQKVYEAGIDVGKKSEYDAFWDALQKNGTASNYEYAFGSRVWTDKMFKPKYNITLAAGYTATDMFARSNITNVKQRLIEAGVVLDTSACTYFTRMFYNAKTTEIPTIDISNAKGTQTLFASASIVSIDKVIISETTKINVDMFSGATKLKDIVFDGVIGSNLDMSQCTNLSKASITSIMNALSTTATGKTLTLSQDAVEVAFIPDDVDEWAALVNARSNWTITMI